MDQTPENHSSSEIAYNALLQTLVNKGVPYDEAEAIALSQVAEVKLAEEKQARDQALANLSDEIKDKVIIWRNAAFSNAEIIQKLTEKYNLPEKEAKFVVKNIHLHQVDQEKVVIQEHEEKKEHNYNLYMGMFLFIGGLIGGFLMYWFDEEGDFDDVWYYFFAAAIGGFIQMIAGLSKQKYESE